MCKSNNKFNNLKNIPQNVNQKQNIKTNSFKTQQFKQGSSFVNENLYSKSYQPQQQSYPQFEKLVHTNMIKFNNRMQNAFPLRYEYYKIYDDDQSLQSNEQTYLNQNATKFNLQFPLVVLDQIKHINFDQGIQHVYPLFQINQQFSSSQEQVQGDLESTSATLNENKQQ